MPDAASNRFHTAGKEAIAGESAEDVLSSDLNRSCHSAGIDSMLFSS